jgi:hypothetical protein
MDRSQALDVARKWQKQAVTVYAIMMSDSFRWDAHYAGRVSVTEHMIELKSETGEAVAHMTLLSDMTFAYGDGILTIGMLGWRCFLRGPEE